MYTFMSLSSVPYETCTASRVGNITASRVGNMCLITSNQRSDHLIIGGMMISGRGWVPGGRLKLWRKAKNPTYGGVVIRRGLYKGWRTNL